MHKQNAAGPPPIAVVQIVLMADGGIASNLQGELDRPRFNMMIETAKQDLLTILYKKEREAAGGLVRPPAGLQVPRNDQGG